MQKMQANTKTHEITKTLCRSHKNHKAKSFYSAKAQKNCSLGLI